MILFARLPASVCLALALSAHGASDQKSKTPARASVVPGSVLMIGDSLSLGTFGEEMESFLRDQFGKEHVAFFASCGSSPESWLRPEPVYVTKCGYRETTPQGQVRLDFHDGKPPAKKATPKVQDLLATYRPTMVIVQLGTNWMDRIATLNGRSETKYDDILNRFLNVLRGPPQTVRRIVWITPPDASKYSDAVKQTVDRLILTAPEKSQLARKHQIVFFARSSKMTQYVRGTSGGDGVHYNNRASLRWAYRVERELSSIFHTP